MLALPLLAIAAVAVAFLTVPTPKFGAWPMEERVYPIDCQSAYCGRTSCNGCPMLPKLSEFKAWRHRTAAVQRDRIWSPSVYTATKSTEV